MIACDLHENHEAAARSKYPEVVNILVTLMFQEHDQHLWTLTMMALSCYMQQFLSSTAQIYCWRWCSRNSVCGDADEMSELKLNVRVKTTNCSAFLGNSFAHYRLEFFLRDVTTTNVHKQEPCILVTLQGFPPDGVRGTPQRMTQLLRIHWIRHLEISNDDPSRGTSSTGFC